MPFTGEKVFEVSEKEARFSSNVNELKLDKNQTVKVVFYGGIESLVGMQQHAFWAKPFDKTETPNDENIIFECFRSKAEDQKVSCPGCMYDNPQRKWRYGIPVLVEGDNEPKALYFGPMIYNQLRDIYKGDFVDTGTTENFNKHFFRLERDDTTGRTEYKLRLTFGQVQDPENFPEVINLADSPFDDNEVDIALRMKTNNLWNEKMENHYFAENEGGEVLEEAS